MHLQALRIFQRWIIKRRNVILVCVCFAFWAHSSILLTQELNIYSWNWSTGTQINHWQCLHGTLKVSFFTQTKTNRCLRMAWRLDDLIEFRVWWVFYFCSGNGGGGAAAVFLRILSWLMSRAPKQNQTSSIEWNAMLCKIWLWIYFTIFLQPNVECRWDPCVSIVKSHNNNLLHHNHK